jgi:hypothetical protein
MRSFPRRISRAQRRKAERGVALVLVMICLALMLLLGLAATLTSITEVHISTNLGLQIEAFDTADAGSVHAFELVRYMRGDFTELIRGEDNNMKTGDEFKQHTGGIFNSAGVRTALTGANTNMFDATKVTPIPKTGTRSLVRLDPRHFYELLVYDDAGDPKAWLTDQQLEKNTDSQWATRYNQDFDQRVMIRSIGYVMSQDTALDAFNPANNVIASAVVDIVVGLTPFPAIISNDDLDLTNSIAVSGAFGSVHANDDLLLGNGNFTVSQSATFANGDGVTPSGGWNSSADDSHVTGYNGPAGAITIPDIKPQDYASDCTVVYIHKLADTTERNALIAHMNAKAAGSGTALVNAITGAGKTLTTAESMCLRRTGTSPYTYQWVGSSPNNNYALSSDGYTFNFKTNGSGPGADLQAIPNASGAGVFVLLPRGINEITANAGLTGYISLFTNGNVFMNGNADLRPAINITPPEQPPWDFLNILVCAGEDIRMQGNASGNQALRGIFYAHEGFDMTGSAVLQGQIIGYEKRMDYDALSGKMVTTSGFSTTATGATNGNYGSVSPVPVHGSILHGNFQVLFNAGTGFLGTFAQVAWRQLHDFKPVTDAR